MTLYAYYKFIPNGTFSKLNNKSYLKKFKSNMVKHRIIFIKMKTYCVKYYKIIKIKIIFEIADKIIIFIKIYNFKYYSNMFKIDFYLVILFFVFFLTFKTIRTSVT